MRVNMGKGHICRKKVCFSVIFTVMLDRYEAAVISSQS